MEPARILVAVDERPISKDIWREACLLASAHGAELHLVTVTYHVEFSMDHDAERDRAAVAFSELRELAAEEEVTVGSTRFVSSRTAAAAILAAAREVDADWILLGAGEKTTLQRVLLGSTAERVAREAPQAVWLVRPAEGIPRLGKLLCAVDESLPSREALAVALPLARRLEAQLIVASVAPADGGDGVDPVVERECALSDVVGSLETEGVDLWFQVVQGEAHEELMTLAQDHGCDLIVLGTAGRVGIQRLLHANTAGRLARRAPCSLLVVPAPVEAGLGSQGEA